MYPTEAGPFIVKLNLPDPEKLKGDLGEGGAVAGPAGAPHQRAKPTDKQ